MKFDEFEFSAVVLIVLFIIGFSFLMSWPVYALWNGCLVPAVRGLNEISWLQAWGIGILFNILFKPTNSKNKVL